MLIKRRILKWVYPALMLYNKLTGKAFTRSNEKMTLPPVPFHSLKALTWDGQMIDFSTLRGRYVLLVNTASDCGYTAQYKALQRLQEQYADKLVILAFPSDDHNQEKGNNKDIAAFCRSEYHLSFPLMQKCRVRKGEMQHPVYRWVTDKQMNGWNELSPRWNFDKFLITPQGILSHHFSSSVSPFTIPYAFENLGK